MSNDKIQKLQNEALYPDNGVFQFTGTSLKEYRKAVREDTRERIADTLRENASHASSKHESQYCELNLELAHEIEEGNV